MLLPHLLELVRRESALHRTQKEVTQLAGKAHHGQRWTEFFRPGTTTVFHVAVEEFADGKVLLRTGDQTDLLTFTAMLRFSSAQKREGEGVNRPHDRFISHKTQSGQLVRQLLAHPRTGFLRCGDHHHPIRVRTSSNAGSSGVNKEAGHTRTSFTGDLPHPCIRQGNRPRPVMHRAFTANKVGPWVRRERGRLQGTHALQCGTSVRHEE